MTDTRWEEAKEDIKSSFPNSEYDIDVDSVLNKLEEKGWTICYPYDWPDLCSNCKSHIDEGTWHSVFNGNQIGSCEVHVGPPRGMVERNWQTPGAEKVMIPYWGDPKTKNTES